MDKDKISWGEFADYKHPEKGRYLIVQDKHFKYVTKHSLRTSELTNLEWLLKNINTKSAKKIFEILDTCLPGMANSDYSALTKYFKSWTYIIGMNGTPLLKIGKANNPYDRLKTMSVTVPIDLGFHLVAVKPENIEKHLHKEYAEYRRVGEWFDIAEILDKITSKYDFLLCQN